MEQLFPRCLAKDLGSFLLLPSTPRAIFYSSASLHTPPSTYFEANCYSTSIPTITYHLYLRNRCFLEFRFSLSPTIWVSYSSQNNHSKTQTKMKSTKDWHWPVMRTKFFVAHGLLGHVLMIVLMWYIHFVFSPLPYKLHWPPSCYSCIFHPVTLWSLCEIHSHFGCKISLLQHFFFAVFKSQFKCSWVT